MTLPASTPTHRERTRPLPRPISLLLPVLALGFAWALPATAGTTSPPKSGFSTWNEARLLAWRESAHGAPGPGTHPALLRLKAEAREAGAAPALSVLDKSKRGASGDPRDFYSLAPYWWPDPASPTGLPYIWRDGTVNPEALVGTDSPAFRTMVDRVESLTLAWWIFGDEAAGARAAELIQTWFFDEKTGMNPHLEYAQEIPGVRTGSGIGIIGLRRVAIVLDSVRALRGHPAWTAERDAAFSDWLARYLQWLLDSGHGALADRQHNNHGTFYDFQVAQLALFLGRDELARERLGRGVESRLLTHVDASGAQPKEAARTRGLYYTAINLSGLAALANLGEAIGAPWWREERMRLAMLHLARFLDPKEEWPHKDIDSFPRHRIAAVLLLAPEGVLPPALREAAEAAARETDERWALTGAPLL